VKISCLFTGKTSDALIEAGVKVYLKRLMHYVSVEVTEIPASTGNSEAGARKEADAILKKITPRDFVVVLDEKGSSMSSTQLAGFVEKKMNMGVARLVFITGGAFGVDEKVAGRADLVLSFSKMTFTHQMIRLLLVEQLYRAMTIIRREKYHHE